MEQHTLKLDTNDTPAWDLTLLIRGVEVATLSPLTAADRSIVNLGPRRSGVAVRLWRWLFGEPRVAVADDHETIELRRTVAACVGNEHHGLLLQLSGGELLAVLGNYVGAQSAWYGQIERSARAEAERVWGEMTGAGGTSPIATGHNAPSVMAPAGKGVTRVSVAPSPLVPGGPLPAWLGDAAVVPTVSEEKGTST